MLYGLPRRPNCNAMHRVQLGFLEQEAVTSWD
jgi:hypothetical protein